MNLPLFAGQGDAWQCDACQGDLGQDGDAEQVEPDSPTSGSSSSGSAMKTPLGIMMVEDDDFVAEANMYILLKAFPDADITVVASGEEAVKLPGPFNLITSVLCLGPRSALPLPD